MSSSNDATENHKLVDSSDENQVDSDVQDDQRYEKGDENIDDNVDVVDNIKNNHVYTPKEEDTNSIKSAANVSTSTNNKKTIGQISNKMRLSQRSLSSSADGNDVNCTSKNLGHSKYKILDSPKNNRKRSNFGVGYVRSNSTSGAIKNGSRLCKDEKQRDLDTGLGLVTRLLSE